MEKKPIIIKKYSNRRLYNTEISNYVTLQDLCQLVKKNVEFTVVDARTGEDLTRLTLTQIIFEQESKGYNMLPISFLRQLIGYYDDGLRSILPQYLSTTMELFTSNQEKMRQQMSAIKGFFPSIEDVTRQQMMFFESALKMFGNSIPGQREKDEQDQDKNMS